MTSPATTQASGARRRHAAGYGYGSLLISLWLIGDSIYLIAT